MKKSHVTLGVLILVLVLVLVTAIGYVSLLGENNKIDELTQTFFQEIRGDIYGEATSGARVKAPGRPEELSDSLFLLEVSLLKHYGLLDSDSYEVATKRSHLWIPFMEDKPVDVAVSLRKKSEGRSVRGALSGVKRLWSSEKDSGLIEHLLTVRRRNGNWVVESVNISGSVIEKTYDDMRERLQSHQYVTKVRHGFMVHEFSVNLDALDPIERRLLVHAFQRAQIQLEVPRPTVSTDRVQALRLR